GVSGADTSAPWDTNASLPDVVDTANEAVVSTTAANTFIFAAYDTQQGAGTLPGAGFTPIANPPPYFFIEYQIVSAPQTNLTCGISNYIELNVAVGDAIVAAGAAPAAYPFRRNRTYLGR
ncbi:MAG: hypothetical protein ACREFJ_07835, partial [Acetobacteraceae bacterium]